ncbi:MAG: histidinol dehydrogenase [Micrococcales bacterium]|nr:histidinol dehydrogenase [Micrococcales bacterium]
MISRIDLRGRTLTRRELIATLPRAEMDVEHAAARIAPVVDDVRERGADALRDYAEKFDRVRPERLRVPGEVIQASVEALDPAVRAGLVEAIARVRRVHAAQRPSDFTVEVAPGARVRQRWIPVRRVGLYVPGGLAMYPSSVVMNVVAAQEAGVGSLAVTSPPQATNNGLPDPVVLGTCGLLGVDEVYAAGGAQAVAMLAYGAAEADGTVVCEPVDVITGPGNVYVAAAKRLVRGVVGIDAEAGPTEVAILADATADPRHVAADLLSQAEHDPMAASVLVTDDLALADATAEALAAQLAVTANRERAATALAGPQSAIVLVDDMAAGLEVVDAYGAEHLEIQTVDAERLADQVTSAGAIFVGPWSPVSLGDYVAGSNHVLPTAGAAHYASGLGVHSYVRAVQVIEYDADALAEVADHVVALADAERLPAHGAAVRVRLENDA